MSRDLDRMRRDQAAFGQHVERAIWVTWAVALVVVLMVLAVGGIGLIWLARTVL